MTADWNGFAVLHTAAARVGGLDIGFVPGEGGKDVAGMLGGDATCCSCSAPTSSTWPRPASAFVVYIGTHGDAGAHRANVILPAAAYTEKSGTYVNTEGRVQMTNRAGFAPGEAREDWAILRALSDVLGKRLPFDSLAQLRGKLYARLPASAPHRPDRGRRCRPISASWRRSAASWARRAFTSPVKDFYLTNPIARASAVMAECSALARSGFKQAAE